MSQAFNPYWEWLRIDCHERPDPCALLGVPEEEGDRALIAAAADRRIAELRKRATKERLELARRVAREIREARDLLLSAHVRSAAGERADAPPSRQPVIVPPRAFDDDEEQEDVEDELATLDEDDVPLEGIAIPPNPDEDHGVAALQLEAPPVAAPSVALPSVGVRKLDVAPRRSRPSTTVLIAAGATIGLLGAAAGVMIPKWIQPTPAVAIDTESSTPAAPLHTDFGYRAPDGTAGRNSSAAPIERQADPPEAIAPPASSPPLATPTAEMAQPEATETMPDTSPSVSTPPDAPMEAMAPSSTPVKGGRTAEEAAENLKTTQGNLAAVREAMSDGDIDDAVERIELAELEAIDEEPAENVAKTRALLEYLRGFWRAADEGFLGLAAGQEFEFDGRTVVVVERTPDRLIVRSAGRNRSYERKRLPSDWAEFLAKRWLKPDDANTPLFLAAFHAFDQDGDPAEARTLANAAKAAGTPGAEGLLAELDAAADE